MVVIKRWDRETDREGRYTRNSRVTTMRTGVPRLIQALFIFAGLLAACQTWEGVKEDVRSVREAVGDARKEPEPTHAAPGEIGKLAFSHEPDIRVRVAAGVDRREIAGFERLEMRPVGSAKGSLLVVPSPVSVRSTPQGIRISHAEGENGFAPGVNVEITGAEGRRGSLVVGGTLYPGTVIIAPDWAKAPERFDVVIAMPIETYLPGVLTHELFKDWPRQTFEAQAIASRSYALHERSRSRADGRVYDVEATTADQMYGGATAAMMPTEAVRATRGLVLEYQGRVLRAYYSSTCGGRAASAGSVWRTDAGYEFNLAAPLLGRPRPHFCQASRHYRWNIVRRAEDVQRRLRDWGRANTHAVAEVGRLREVTVDYTNPAGRPSRYRLTDDRGREFLLSAEELRNALNFPASGTEPVTMANLVKSGDLEVEVVGDDVRIRGRGWGHGVGMCQWCAKGMGDAGWDWATMLKEFYPGANVVRAYP
jgi:stage II sporulation protein D